MLLSYGAINQTLQAFVILQPPMMSNQSERRHRASRDVFISCQALSAFRERPLRDDDGEVI
jgi:hypothetical protein